MLLFAKDIRVKDHRHALENEDPDFKKYMDYQRRVFPYTVFRAGLDLAYRELDDILNYVDNQYKPPLDSQRKEYPQDIDDWFGAQYPWSCNFLNRDAVHSLLVVLIQGMESYRTYERMNIYHWMVLYDVIHNVVQFYNDLITFSPDRVADIQLTQKVQILFDDFINNYWSNLDFMILSKPDYSHERLQERNRKIEKTIQDRINEGDSAPIALEKVAPLFNLEEETLTCLRRDPVTTRLLELKAIPMEEEPYAPLYEKASKGKELSLIDQEYSLNYKFFKKSSGASSFD